MCGGLDLRAAGRGVAVADVGLDRAVEEDGVLRDDADRPAERVLRHAAHVLLVDEDDARVDVIEAKEEARDRRLAGTGRTDDRRRAARDGDEGDGAEPARALGRIREVDLAQLDPRSRFGVVEAQGGGVGLVADVGG